MLNHLDVFFLEKSEPEKSCLLYLRKYILNLHPSINEEWKYGLPFYYCNKKMFCYLWLHKKLKHPYIGFVDGANLNHPDLLQEKRAKMKIFLVNASKDIPIKKLEKIFSMALKLRLEMI
jgi:hypothetical protein